MLPKNDALRFAACFRVRFKGLSRVVDLVSRYVLAALRLQTASSDGTNRSGPRPTLSDEEKTPLLRAGLRFGLDGEDYKRTLALAGFPKFHCHARAVVFFLDRRLTWMSVSRQPAIRDGFPDANQQAKMRGLATRRGSTVALVANESINQHFKSPAEHFCRW